MLIDTRKHQQQSFRKIFWQGFLSDVLNPKVAIFFLAFLPQFIDTESQNQILQMIILGVTLNMICIVFYVILVYFASAVSRRLRQNRKIATWLNKVMGVTFVSLGVKLAYD